MRIRLPAAVLIFVSLLAPANFRAGRAAHHRIALVARDGVALRAAPSAHGRVLAMLVQQTQVEVLHTGATWDRVRVWASASGWLARKDLTSRHLWPSTSTYHAPTIHRPIAATAPARIRVWANVTAPTGVATTVGGTPTRWLSTGARIRVEAWRQDARGNVWYLVDGGWAEGAGIQFSISRNRSQDARRAPIWAAVAGKGMWLTLGTISGTDSNFLAAAARRDGISHLYLESAISPLGFHGREAVGPLIEAAHRAGIHVVAWVYPYLQDIAADVKLTRQVAAYRTPSGQRFDGVAVDLETNVTLESVRSYSQLVRLYLGPDYLLVGVTYPPQSWASYPFGEVALRYDVLAPMDYWHDTRGPFGSDYGHLAYGQEYAMRYAAGSIAGIRRQAPGAVVAPIGQTFDNFGRLEMGPFAPSSSEIRGFCAGAKATGAIGVSFFQWMTATPDEFAAIRAFHF